MLRCTSLAAVVLTINLSLGCEKATSVASTSITTDLGETSGADTPGTTGGLDSGTPTDTGGTTGPLDQGTPPSDPGTPPGDPGTPPSDPGTPPSDPGTPPADPGTPPVDVTQDIGQDLPKPGKAIYSTFLGDWSMKPGAETTKCVVKRLDNEMPLWIKGIHTKMQKGSHHLIVYATKDTKEQPTPFECTPFTDTLSGDGLPLMISQIPDETLSFPPGTAWKLEPHQMIRLEAHYLNYYPEDVTAHADVEFLTIDPAEVKAEVGLLFYGTPDFKIPPGKEYTTPWNFIDVWEGSHVFALTGHTHAKGTNVEIQFSTAKDKPGTPLYPGEKPYSWSEPPVVNFTPDLEMKKGEGFRYRCTWFNDTPDTLQFGESGNKEMCFLWAYYYPNKGYRMCVNPGKYAAAAGGLVGDQVCCPDDAFICDVVKGYLKNGLP